MVFAGHVIAANFILIAIGLGAYGVLVFTHVLHDQQAPRSMLRIGSWVEEGLLWLDAIVYVIYVPTKALEFLQSIVNVEWRPTGTAFWKIIRKR